MGQFAAAVKGMGEACRSARLPGRRPATSRSTTRPTASASRPRPPSAASAVMPDVARSPTSPQARGRPAGRHRPRGRAASASRSISRSSATKLEGAPPPVRPRRRDQGRPPHPLADPREARSRPCTTSRTADCWWPSPRWRWLQARKAAASASSCSRYEGKLPAHAIWFGEDQGRYVVAVDPSGAEEILERARLLDLPARIIGRTGGAGLSLRGEARPAAHRACGRARDVAAGVYEGRGLGG